MLWASCQSCERSSLWTLWSWSPRCAAQRLGGHRKVRSPSYVSPSDLKSQYDCARSRVPVSPSDSAGTQGRQSQGWVHGVSLAALLACKGLARIQPFLSWTAEPPIKLMIWNFDKHLSS
jgi:hypothetical protein